MIEDSIQALRRAAKISSEEPSEKNETPENLWCVMAGNDKLIDDIAYDAISSKDRVKILFREHVTLEEEKVNKKFDFIMLNGTTSSINNLSNSCHENGGAHIKISPYYVNEEPNLMLLVAPDDIIRKFVINVEKHGIPFAILLEDKTTGFIETDLNSNFKIPRFLKNMLSPLLNMSDVVLSTVLITVDNDDDVNKVQDIATSNKIFVIDFKDIDMEA